jgi:hypothetical protein
VVDVEGADVGVIVVDLPDVELDVVVLEAVDVLDAGVDGVEVEVELVLVDVVF